MPDYNNFDCHFFRTTPITRNLVQRIIDTIDEEISWLQVSESKEALVNYVMNQKDYTDATGSVLFGDEFYIHLEKAGEGHFIVEINSFAYRGTAFYFEEWPEFAHRFRELFSLVGQLLDAYLGYEIETYHVIFNKHFDTMSSIYRHRWMLQNSGTTYYLDQDMMTSLDEHEVRKWAHSVDRLPNGSFLLDLEEIPFINYMKWPEVKSHAIEKQIYKPLFERLRQNLKSQGIRR